MLSGKKNILWIIDTLLYTSHEKFRRDKVSVRKVTRTLFAEISKQPKLSHAETFWKHNFLH